MPTPDTVIQLERDDTKKSFEDQCGHQLHCEICQEDFDKLSKVVTLYYVLLYLSFKTFRYFNSQKLVHI